MKRSFNLDKLVSISAVITAAIAVVIAIFELRTTREYQKLSVEPYIQLYNSKNNGYELILKNSGLGPAKIKSVDVKLNNKPASNWNEIIHILTELNHSKLTYAHLFRGHQILASEKVVVLNLPEDNVAKLFHNNISIKGLTIDICYCSIYNDCWNTHFPGLSPDKVASCPNDMIIFPQN